MESHRIVIVDPYSAGSSLAEALCRRGTRCTAVLIDPPPSETLQRTFHPEHFEEVLHHRGDIEETLGRVRERRPRHVVAGSSGGIELADRLAERLELPGNGTALSTSRNDKYLMHEVIGRHGLRSAKQRRAIDAAELARAAGEIGWPVVVKPVCSVGSDGVALCQNASEVREASEAILSAPNKLGRPNRAVVAQQYLNGREYVVDTVSYDGRHKVTAFWAYDRPQATECRVWYDSMMLIAYDGDLQRRVRRYVFDVLDRLGIRFGPAHCEVICEEGEPVLVEVNARLTAAANATLSALCGGPCQLDDTVTALLDPDAFLATVDAPSSMHRYAANVFLVPPARGRLLDFERAETLKKLATFQAVEFSARPGKTVGRCAGIVTLAGDHDALRRDISAIRAFEQDGLFVLPESAVSV